MEAALLTVLLEPMAKPPSHTVLSKPMAMVSFLELPLLVTLFLCVVSDVVKSSRAGSVVAADTDRVPQIANTAKTALRAVFLW